jgi:hypothetical protein
MGRRAWTTGAMVGIVLLVVVGCSDGQIDAGGTLSELEGAGGQLQGAASEVRGAVDEIGQEIANAGQSTEGGGDAQPTEAVTEEPAAADGEFPWVPVVLTALVLLAVVALFAILRRRDDASAQRGALRDEALRETDWLLDATSEPPMQVDAAPRARDIRVHTDRLVDALRGLQAQADQRVAEAAFRLHDAATALAGFMIARLDDVAAGRPPSVEGDIGPYVDGTVEARNILEDVAR